jgi:hypothetical protein
MEDGKMSLGFTRSVLALVGLCLATSAAAWEIQLTAEEYKEVGGPRRITCGVPLLVGQAKDVKDLRVTCDGKPVPAQFRELARWWRADNSLRWVLVDLAADVKGLEKKAFVLTDAPARDGSIIKMDKGPPKDARFEDNLFMEIDEPWYAIRSSDVGLTVGVSWTHEVYRGLWFWLNHGCLDYPWFGRTRNLGLEPASTLTEDGLGGYVKNREALHLGEGRSMNSRVALSVREGVDEVRRVKSDGSIVV